MSEAILSCARTPLERAGKSVRWMAERLNKLEVDLSTKVTDAALATTAASSYSAARVAALAESKKLLKRFGLVDLSIHRDEAVSGDKGGLHSRLLKTTLTAVTQYEVSVGSIKGSFGMVRLASTCSRAKLTKHESELEYLKEKLRDI